MPFDRDFPDYCQAPERKTGNTDKPDIVTLLTHLGAHPSQQHSQKPMDPHHIRTMLDKLLTLYWKESVLVYQLQGTSNAFEKEIGTLVNKLDKGKDAIKKFMAPLKTMAQQASEKALVGSIAVTYHIPFVGLAFQGLFLTVMMRRLADYLTEQKVPAPGFIDRLSEWSGKLARMQEKIKCYELAADAIEKKLVRYIRASHGDVFDEMSRRDDDKPVESGVVKYLDITSAFAKDMFGRLGIDREKIMGKKDGGAAIGRMDIKLKTSAYARSSEDIKHKIVSERFERIKKITPYLEVEDEVLKPVNDEIKSLRNKISAVVTNMLLGDVGVFHGLETVTRCIYRLTALDIKSYARAYNTVNVASLYDFWGKKKDLNDALRRKLNNSETNVKERDATFLKFYKLWVDARTRKEKPLNNAYIQSTLPSAWPEGQAGIRKWSSKEVRHKLDSYQGSYGENVTDQRYTNQRMISVGRNNIMRRALVRVKQLALQPVLAGPLHLIQSDDSDFHDSQEHGFKVNNRFNQMKMHRSGVIRDGHHSLPRSDSARNLTLHA